MTFKRIYSLANILKLFNKSLNFINNSLLLKKFDNIFVIKCFIFINWTKIVLIQFLELSK